MNSILLVDIVITLGGQFVPATVVGEVPDHGNFDAKFDRLPSFLPTEMIDLRRHPIIVLMIGFEQQLMSVLAVDLN